MSNIISLEQINDLWLPDRRIGKAQAKSSPKMLQFADYSKADVPVPEFTDHWKKRVAFPAKSYGNRGNGCCTIASQAVNAVKMERLEQKRTIEFTEDEILRVYYNMTSRLYGGGDTGAYELDALNNWRNPDFTFRDKKGRPHIIEAFVRINHTSNYEIKKAIHLSAAKSAKVCFNLPWAWSSTIEWTFPDGQPMSGNWMPGSWGGHSMTSAEDYNMNWLYINHTWFDLDKKKSREAIGRVSWSAVSAFCDEAYLVIDKVNEWKKRIDNKVFNLKALVSDVNSVSEIKIK